MKSSIAVLAMAASLGPAAADDRTMTIGELELSYDPAVWEIATLPNNAGDLLYGRADPGALFIVCIAPECRDRPFVSASVHPETAGGATLCSPTAVDGGIHGDRNIRALPPPKSAIPLVRWVSFSGCRSYVPRADRACGLYNGLLYRFATGGHFGCAGIGGVEPAQFDALLGRLTLRGDTGLPEKDGTGVESSTPERQSNGPPP